jgi:hypothetical protein
MPFAKGARIEIENQANVQIESFYFNIDYIQIPSMPFKTTFIPEVFVPLPDLFSDFKISFP